LYILNFLILLNILIILQILDFLILLKKLLILDFLILYLANSCYSVDNLKTALREVFREDQGILDCSKAIEINI